MKEIKALEFTELQKAINLIRSPLSLRILNYIIKNNGENKTVTDIYEAMRIEQSYCSGILGRMRKVGLVDYRKQGKWFIYYPLIHNIRAYRDFAEQVKTKSIDIRTGK